MDIVGIKRFLNKNKDKTLDEIISESVVNGIGNVIGNSGSPAGTDTLFGLLKRGMLKSVQRGTFKGGVSQETWSEINRNVSINISTVNPAKCEICFREKYTFTNGGSENILSVGVARTSLQALNANSIVIKQPYYTSPRRGDDSRVYYNSMQVDWELREYY